MSRQPFHRQLLFPLLAAVVCALLLYVVVPALLPQTSLLPEQVAALPPLTHEQYEQAAALREWALNLTRVALWLSLMFLAVRVAGEVVFNFGFRLRKGQAAPRLLSDIFSLAAYAVLTALILKHYFPALSLGALFSGSALLGIILGLALQDTLGNLFAGISLHADQPFAVGDVITVGQWTGVVESVTWRAAKLRTFTNRLVLVSNSQIAKESIEVAPRNNRNARIVFFNALYSDSPAKVIHVVREAVREADNVAREITPIVRVRALADSGVDYEVKYWLEDYARYNDTDALVRQRIWYAFRRAGLTAAYPTRTVHVEPRHPRTDKHAATQLDLLAERLAAVDIFAPLSAEELSHLAREASRHIYAHGETIIRHGEQGDSMFVVHRGTVEVRTPDRGHTAPARIIATLGEGDFFGEMGLFTGQPRTARVVAVEETEVLEIGHRAMKNLFAANPDLVASLSHTISERRAALAAQTQTAERDDDGGEGLVSSIKRFFGLN